MKKINFLVCSIFIGLGTIQAQTTQATNTVTNGNSYLGTSNDYDVLFKRFGIEAGKLTTNSVSFGVGAKALSNSVAIGYGAGKLSTGIGNNTYIGHFSGIMSSGNNNISIGFSSGNANEGNSNIFIGNFSGSDDGSGGDGNIFIGHGSGNHVYESNKLFIENSYSEIPLIWGDFLDDKLKFNAKVGVGYGFNNYPTTAGSVSVTNYNLFVKGGILTEEVRVSLQSTWADYVFGKDYKLPTLNEVENHINEKGHLINVPSAKEVKENGIELGEMAKIQQEKIEELTLYVIEQNKINEKQGLELEKQNKKIEELKTMINVLLEKSK